MSWGSDCEVAASSVGMAMPRMEARMTRRRARRSVSAPKKGAESATAMVAAETVSPAEALVTWKRWVKSGSRGWVQ